MHTSMTYSRVPRMPRIQVARERLLRRIDRAPAATLMSGPPGFGKTTLAGQWTRSLARQRQRFVWITVDRDTDATVLWRLTEVAFAAALDTALPEAGPHPSARVAAMLSDHSDPVGWVIDGVSRELPRQLIDDIFALVAHTPNLRLLMCADGPAPSIIPAQLSLEVDVISAAELAFTRNETRQVLRAQEKRLPDDLVSLLHRQVEGWPLLVSASAALLPDRPNSTDVHRVAHEATGQLAQHYLTAMGPSLADFFLRASIPDRLTPPVFEAMTGVSDARRRLDRLTSMGILTSAEVSGDTVYAFPTAVRDTLRDSIRRAAPEEYHRLLETLTHCHLEQGECHAVDALRSALRSEEVGLVAKVVEAQWLAILRVDRLLLADALALLAPQTIAASRALTSAQTLAVGIWPLKADRPALPAESSQLATLGTGSDADEFLLHHTALSIAARRDGRIDEAAGRFGRLVLAADAASQNREPRILPELSTVYTQAGFTYLLAGQLVRARDLLRQAYDLREHHRLGYAGLDASGKLALASALEGDITAARGWLSAGDEYERLPDRYEGWLLPYIESSRRVARGLCLLEDGRLLEAAGELEVGPGLDGDECELVAFSVRMLHGRFAGTARPLLDEWTASWHAIIGHLNAAEGAAAIATAGYADLLMAVGHGTRAGAVLRSCGADAQELQVSAARWALLTGRLDEAQYLASRLLWETAAHRRTRVHMQLILAAVHDQEGRQDDADSMLAQAVALGHRYRMRLPFADADRDLLVRRAGVVEGLAAMLSDLDHGGFAPVFPARLEVIGLSNREQAVLEALDTGLPVERIAQKLFVSTNTVKTQMRSLYVKLGTHSRVDTLVKAREQGLLPMRRALPSAGRRHHQEPTPGGRQEDETAGV